MVLQQIGDAQQQVRQADRLFQRARKLLDGKRKRATDLADHLFLSIGDGHG